MFNLSILIFASIIFILGSREVKKMREGLEEKEEKKAENKAFVYGVILVVGIPIFTAIFK